MQTHGMIQPVGLIKALKPVKMVVILTVGSNCHPMSAFTKAKYKVN